MADKIETIINSLRNIGFEDIKKASDGGAKMGAFILCSCLIESVAGFMKGKDTTREDYKVFVRDYLPDYDAEKLYRDLRCKVVHSYSEGGSYYFTDNQPSSHLTFKGGKLVINLEDFMSDIQSALDKYIEKLHDPKQAELREKAIRRYETNGVIEIIPSILDSMTPPVSGSHRKF